MTIRPELSNEYKMYIIHSQTVHCVVYLNSRALETKSSNQYVKLFIIDPITNAINLYNNDITIGGCCYSPIR